ncbi:pantetheine-phosphate adenylyltransferase [Alkaliphilus metalliredigens QYMF]|uniref:Phosphopantetheine adenylyltransferase n=1 Tax=Alkaliphilus metalliredigens (strain QYMF) TaxID=293826 RepID=COAD_ALKMQ|nr:pantetheine-phosphate adenylyltransferase [Alkaliphilus metalliredigens]A6TRV0.1 RecName: Full=Phosphopantetheine adenylyltransferase; AltName: Full=Dephospho-CoA pyrophosphorylase; AltName: Full=Pantetheine-phosphate adenylyltransferase; Short=PPAT [Alkaliphilus metalliredigens QYMF]ABR48918.1 pantetheine-phosphate adenylyltransferase [Alkaliphilus metalliredigens QYMF]
MKVGIYPGSFDPITNGHIDIIKRASEIYDRVIVSVMQNPNKNPMFTLGERVALIEQIIQPYSNIEVDCFSGLLIDYAREKGAKVIIKGLRAVSDFEYELQMALMNRKLCPEVETVFLMTNSQYSYLSSSLVKEVAKFKGDVSEFVPEIVLQAMSKKS